LKKKNQHPQKVKPDEKKQPPVKEAEKDDSFDFGGIPDRNLKKNLGCG
jgi:hypothetical protein